MIKMIFKKDTTIEYFKNKFSEDLKEMYVSPTKISTTDKEIIKEKALSLCPTFKTDIIDFYFNNGGTEINDTNFDTFFNNYEKFTDQLLNLLESLKSKRIIYQSVALMWTGIFTRIEKESKIIDEIGLIKTSQHFLMKLLKYQNEYYNSFKG